VTLATGLLVFSQLPALRAANGFTLGNIVVVRFGDGSAAINGNATKVYLDEYTTTGTFVMEHPLPATPSLPQHQFTNSGSATSEGQLSRSFDGNYLVLAGYDAAPGTTGITTSTSAAVNRVIARADGAGNFDTTTALTDAISGGNPRGAASTNGTDLWISGTATAGGIRSTTLGSTTSTPVSTTTTNLRQVGIFGAFGPTGAIASQLFVSSASGTLRVGTVGTGTPNTSGQTTTNLPGLSPVPASPYGFFFADLNGAVPGVDTLYIADDSTGAGGGILKYSLVGGSWVSNGNVSSAAALRGLTGVVNGNGTVTLYAGGNTSIVTMTDTGGYNGAITGALTSIATAGTNKVFRGIAFTPMTSGSPQPTNPTGVYTATPNPVQAGTSTTLKVVVTPGTNPASTGISVVSDLTAIGIPGPQTFTQGPTNTFTFVATVPASVAPGGKMLTATVADTNIEHSSTTATLNPLTVTASSTSPIGTGTAAPASVLPGNNTLLTVTVTPGTAPASTGLTVTGDLSAIGGSATQAFAANGNTFTFTAAVPLNQPYGQVTVPFTVADAQTRFSTSSISFFVSPPTPPTTLKISQVYGGGGNSGATYTNDFIELFNDSSTDLDVTQWSVQYIGATNNGTWSVTPLCTQGTCTIPAWHYFLVQEGPGAGGTTPLPMPNAAGTIAMSLSQGKVAVVNSTIPLAGQCPGTLAADLVGYGSANCSEGNTAPTLTNSTAGLRRINGCQDTDSNSNDFVAVGPIPRNSLTPANTCGTDLYGLGIAVPDATDPATEVLLTVKVTQGGAPAINNIAVTADLQAVGGGPGQQFFDDGTHGDLVAHDGTYSVLQLVGANVPTGGYNMKLTVTTVPPPGDNTLPVSVTGPISLTVTSPTCGVERWAVKVGTDADALGGAVDLTVPATPAQILELTTRPAPLENDLNTIYARARVPGDTERTVYSIDATLTFYKHEDDVDYHMVLNDGNNHTLIAEIPSPACILADGTPRVFVAGAPFAAGIANSREKFDARLTATTSFQTANLAVRVKGVGFFDFEHGQTGVAPNAIELHPVLDIFFRANTTTTVQFLGTPTYGDPLTFTATVTNGDGFTPTGDVTFFDSVTGSSLVATLNGVGQASFSSAALAAGPHALIASYPGDDNSVPSASAPLNFNVARADQSIDFGQLPDSTYGAGAFTVSASGGASGNPVTFAASGNCQATGNVIAITGAGNCSVTASQAGDTNYNAAGDVTRSFNIGQATPQVTATGGAFTFDGAPHGGSCSVTGVNSDVLTAAASYLPGPGVPTAPGSYALTCSYGGSANYAPASASAPIAINDGVPPVIASVTPSPSSIWPPNKLMVPVTIAVSASDNSGAAPACQVTNVSNNETGTGDATITLPLTVNLLADRRGNGDGRVYIIAVRCVDGSGNVSMGTTSVTVPHDQGK
jgi:hypothetical protein